MTAVPRGCRIGRYLDTLPPDDQDAVDRTLTEWGGAKLVWAWLQNRGVQVSVSAVRTHKRRECPCRHTDTLKEATAA